MPRTAVACVLLAQFCSCASEREPRPLSAQAFIDGRAGNSTRGLARFVESPGGLQVSVELLDAPPGLHSVHVDSFRDCGWVSIGGHFNPERQAHGARGDQAGHAGDFGDIEISTNGTGRIEFIAERLTLREGPLSILGLTIVIDERRDDPLAQPWGDSGAPIACGLIRLQLN